MTKWWEDRKGTKTEATRATWRHAIRTMREFFCEGGKTDILMTDINAYHAEAYESWLETSGGDKGGPLALGTVRQRMKVSKKILADAVKYKALESDWGNPFDGRRTASVASPQSRQKFITLKEFGRLLDACSGPEWRGLLLLARIGGCRIPSEARNLKWDHITWTTGTRGGTVFVERSAKNANKEGGGDRLFPLWPELERGLLELSESQPDGTDFVFPNLRETTNIGPTIDRIVARAGFGKWPKPAQNMRATRATEIEHYFSGAQAAEWCGHTERIASSHYWMVTTHDVDKAAQWWTVANRDDTSDSEFLAPDLGPLLGSPTGDSGPNLELLQAELPISELLEYLGNCRKNGETAIKLEDLMTVPVRARGT